MTRPVATPSPFRNGVICPPLGFDGIRSHRPRRSATLASTLRFKGCCSVMVATKTGPAHPTRRRPDERSTVAKKRGIHRLRRMRRTGSLTALWDRLHRASPRFHAHCSPLVPIHAPHSPKTTQIKRVLREHRVSPRCRSPLPGNLPSRVDLCPLPFTRPLV